MAQPFNICLMTIQESVYSGHFGAISLWPLPKSLPSFKTSKNSLTLPFIPTGPESTDFHHQVYTWLTRHTVHSKDQTNVTPALKTKLSLGMGTVLSPFCRPTWSGVLVLFLSLAINFVVLAIILSIQIFLSYVLKINCSSLMPTFDATHGQCPLMLSQWLTWPAYLPASLLWLPLYGQDTLCFLL